LPRRISIGEPDWAAALAVLIQCGHRQTVLAAKGAPCHATVFILMYQALRFFSAAPLPTPFHCRCFAHESSEASGTTGGKGALARRRTIERLKLPNGLRALGYTSSEIPALVEGTLPQHRVTKLSPRVAGPEELARLFEEALVAF